MRTTCSSPTSCTPTWCATLFPHLTLALFFHDAACPACWSHCYITWGHAVESFLLKLACPSLDAVNGGLHVTETTVHFCALVVIARFAGMCTSLISADAVHARQDLGDKTIQCGRRADAFKLWLTWKVGVLQKHALPNVSMS